MAPQRSHSIGSFDPLNSWQKAGLIVFAACIVGFACLVEYRSAFLERRRTDAGVYFRAAWAVRSGADPYQITDNNSWHYNYPPLLAILLTPLADAPANEGRAGLLPYPVSVAIWFSLNLLAGLIAIHWLACAMEENSSNSAVRNAPWGSRQWWARRMFPTLICLGPMAHTLVRGQVNLLVLLALVGMLRALACGRNGRAGVWISAAIAIKIIPAFLVLFPLCRRNWRFLGGCVAGLVVGLGLMPLAALGASRTVECYQHLVGSVLLPGLTQSGDSQRAKELTNVTGTGSQSLLVVWHNTLNPDRSTRPTQPAPWLRWTTMSMAALLVLLTLAAARNQLTNTAPCCPAEQFLAWGALIVVMLLVSPVSHMHYQCLLLPLIMGLYELHPPTRRNAPAWLFLAGCFMAAHTFPHVPELAQLREFGLPMYAIAAWWVVAVVVLWRLPAAGLFQSDVSTAKARAPQPSVAA